MSVPLDTNPRAGRRTERVRSNLGTSQLGSGLAVAGAFIVNVGELLEVATGGYLRATRHRVLAPKPGTDRVSVPYFLSPALDARVPIIDLPPELAARSRGVEADPDNPLFRTYGENAWKSRTRAHPDVAEKHHGIRR